VVFNTDLRGNASRSHSIGAEISYVLEGLSHFWKHHDHDSESLHKSKHVPSIPKDRVCTYDELSVN
jgi:[histone H3]-lysine4 N-trimethyltransferase ATXR3